MGLWSILREKIGYGKPVPVNVNIFSDPDVIAAMGSCHIRELAFETAVRLIANAVSKCEFQTFQGRKATKGKEYYLFNVEPNVNQNSSAFIHKWIHALYRNNECLIVEASGQLLVADSFLRKEYALYDDIFTQVTVGNLTFDRSFAMSEVLYFRLNQPNMRRIIDGLYNSYVKLIESGMRAYQKSQGIRGTMAFSTLGAGGSEFQEQVKTILDDRLKAFFNADNAVLPLFDGWKYDELQKRSYANDSTRDIRAMIDDVSDFTAKGFGIPPALLRGEVAGLADALSMFLTFCIDPLCDMLEEEINRKRNGYDGFAAGNYLTIDTKSIKHVDLLGVSTAIDKLISSGVFCVNDIRELVGDEPIDEPWARQHWMTKNYATAQDLLNAADGGGTDAT